ncbi:hypothetical protein NLU13_3177 [Sarocladium strictum]|uniref:Uncharacterized protein n=1 Tax=Sarocladium strictum TaxID=5046 RepID=A0AA39GLK3_SARSR|nr:hypothetical protein NLU13_3177 [Sarocladium strictum]
MWRRGSAICAFGTRALGRSLTTQSSAAEKARSRPLLFSLEVPKPHSISSNEIFSKLKAWGRIANEDGDNAAVVLASPELARKITDDGFMAEFASVLAGPEHRGEFHVLGAAVDHIAPVVGSYQPFQGLSVIRGQKATLLPHLWESNPPKSREDANTAPALRFGVGESVVTVPGANTAFQNQRDFTMVASRFDLSNPQARVLHRLEKTSQHITVPVYEKNEPSGQGFWAPLLPVTQPRAVTASFGNIVKGVEVDGASVPASTELEEAVEKVFKKIPSLAESGPVGIWALVVPKDVYDQVGPHPSFDTATNSQDMVDIAARHVEELHARGAKIFQILSGGGGWGAKKGLLSLDPQRTHFAPSEEESLMRFMGSMEDSDFAPLGSYIQFCTPLRAMSTAPTDSSVDEAIVFGVHDADMPSRECGKLVIHQGLFGALSNKGIFTSGPSGQESKLSVPNSRVFTLDGEKNNVSWSSNMISDPAFLLVSDLLGEHAVRGVSNAVDTGGESVAGDTLNAADLI